jgi:hypothetical protein
MPSGRYHWNHLPKVAREECRKLSAADALDHGIQTVPRKTPRFLPRDSVLCLCPECGAGVQALYQPPIKTVFSHHFGYPVKGFERDWKCAKCWGLTWRSSQTTGTVAAMKEARPRDWKDFLKLYPQWQKCKPENSGERDVAFAEFQKARHRSYNRKKAAKTKSAARGAENSLRRDKSRQRP